VAPAWQRHHVPIDVSHTPFSAISEKLKICNVSMLAIVAGIPLGYRHNFSSKVAVIAVFGRMTRETVRAVAGQAAYRLSGWQEDDEN
jgi:hypothetical protein